MNRLSLKERSESGWSDRAAYLLAAGLGAGFVPAAPGTVGALEGVAIFVALRAFGLEHSPFIITIMILNVVVFAVGVWAAGRACAVTGLEDPRMIVIDEVSGQLIALTPLVFLATYSAAQVLAAFLLFRMFDIFKPYPIRKLERLHGGLGVMADDALAGIYSAALLWAAHAARIF